MNNVQLEKTIGYRFNNKDYLDRALTHSSYNREKNTKHMDNERLEFLGDAFLDAIIGVELFHRMADESEGRLTKTRALIVCEKALADAARKIELGRYLNMGHGEEIAGGRTKDSILADAAGNAVLDTNGNTITVPNGVTSEQMDFQEDGTIGYYLANGNYVPMNQTMAVYQFNNPSGLEKMAGSLLAQTDASGAAMQEATTPGLAQSKVISNHLEGSNVNVADEMVNMIVAQRAYELNSKAITTADSMLETANNLKR